MTDLPFVPDMRRVREGKPAYPRGNNLETSIRGRVCWQLSDASSSGSSSSRLLYRKAAHPHPRRAHSRSTPAEARDLTR
jgi:hypothetical protein